MIFRAAPAWTIITDTLCVTTSCSSAAIRDRSAASARSVAARRLGGGAAQPGGGVGEAAAQHADAEPRRGGGQDREDRGEPAGEPRQRVAERGGDGDGRHGHHGDRQVPVPAVRHRAVGGVHGGAERDRRHVGGVHDDDRGDDDQPGA